MNQIGRRSFLKTLTLTIGGLTVAKTLLAPLHAMAQGKGKAVPMVDPKDGVSKAVGYVEDAKKAPNSKGNDCANCNFYAKKEMRDGKEVGTCLIFAGKYVYAKAYCNSWAKKV